MPGATVGYAYNDLPFRDEYPCRIRYFRVEQFVLQCGSEWADVELTCERRLDGQLHAVYREYGCDLAWIDVEESEGCAVLDSSTAPGVDFHFFESFRCCDLPPRSCAVENGRCGDARVFECVPEWFDVSCQLITSHMAGKDLSGAQLYGTDLSHVDLSFADLTGADLYKVDLHEANLEGANLWDADLERTNLSGATLWGATLPVVMHHTTFIDADLSGVHLNYVWSCSFWRANLNGAVLSTVVASDFQEADLRGANLVTVNMDGSVWVGAIYNAETLPPIDYSVYGMIFVP